MKILFVASSLQHREESQKNNSNVWSVSTKYNLFIDTIEQWKFTSSPCATPNEDLMNVQWNLRGGMSSLMRWEEVQSYPLELERKRYDLQHEAAAIAVTTIVIQWKAPRTSFGQLFPWYENGEGMRQSQPKLRTL